MLLTTEAKVLLYLGQHPEATAIELALAIGVRERTVSYALKALRQDGYTVEEARGRTRMRRVLDRQLITGLKQVARREKDGDRSAPRV